MNRKAAVVLMGAVVLLGGVGYATLRYVAVRQSHFCRACSRPVHQHSRAVAVVDGKRGFYCCPTCALSEHQQSGQNVEVVELTDHHGGGVLKPADSFVVRDSEVNMCQKQVPAISADKQPLHSHFDRCAPSILAFGDRRRAEEFAREHGGQVFRFTDLATSFRR